MFTLTRQGFVKARTAQANQIHGLLEEFGIVIPQGIGSVVRRLPEILEDGENELPGTFRHLLQRLGEHRKEWDRQVDELDAQIQLWHRENAASRKLAEIPGIGPLTARALVASVGDAKSFENGRQLAAWCRGNILVGASTRCWGSANGATAISGCC